MKKILILTLLLIPLFTVTLSQARMAGDFEIPPKKVVKPAPPVQVSIPPSSSSSTSNNSHTANPVGWVSPPQGVTNEQSSFTDPTTGMEMVWVPGGCFQMGSNSGDSDEKPIHKVRVDGFWIGKYEVTQGQWQKVMGNNPSRFKKGNNYPVENVSWNDCQEFIKKLNRRSDKSFRLPTEAEWEYAARSGGKIEEYAGSNYCSGVAWFGELWKTGSHAVGCKAANGLGLYDMSGNVWEWCADWYDKKYYSDSPLNNPKGPSSGSTRVVRGGCWANRYKKTLRTYTRDNYKPSRQRSLWNRFGYGLGFRLVCSGFRN